MAEDIWAQFPDAPKTPLAKNNDDQWAQFPDADQGLGRKQIETRDPNEVDQVPGKTRGEMEAELEQFFSNRSPEWKNKALGFLRNNVLRPAGMAGQAIGEGGLATVTVPVDMLGGLVNQALEKLGVDYRIPNQTQNVRNVLSSPETEPANSVERVGTAAIRGATTAALTAGAAGAVSPATGTSGLSSTGQRIANVLADRPLLQTVSGASGATASETTKELGGGQLAQFIAGLIGASIPPIAAAAGPELTRRLFRGGEEGRQRTAENIKSFKEAGASPTVGQATQTRRAQATESLLSRTPGGAGVMTDAAQKQADDLGAGLERQAATLAPKSSAEQTGRHIVKGISGDSGFIETFKAKQGELYDKLDDFIPSGTRIGVSKTKQALADLNADIPGAPNISEFFKNSKIKSIEGALKADTEGAASVAANPDIPEFANLKTLSKDDQELVASLLADNKLPYEAVKKLRTLVGQQLTDWNALSDVPRSKWKALYAALSDDLGVAAKENGPDAVRAWSRANNYTRAGMQRLDVLQSVLDRNGGPEAVFKAAMSGSKEGASTMRAVMQSLPKDTQKEFAATVVRRLGMAKAGVQNELGDRFSTETLLTNWNLLSPEAKRTLFDRFGPGFRANMDNLAKVTANLRSGSKVFVNPSGTAQAATQAGTAGAFILSVVTGNVPAAASIAGGVTGAYWSARLMTNPKFVAWLAQSTRAPTTAIPAMVNRLAQQAASTNDPDLEAAADLYQQALKDQKQQQNRKAN